MTNFSTSLIRCNLDKMSEISEYLLICSLTLVTLGGTKLIQYLNSKIKDEHARKILTSIILSIERAVRAVF